MPLNSFLHTLRRSVTVVTLTVLYYFALLVATIGQRFTHKQCSRPKKRIILNGTFHNPNWFFAHIEPIVRSGYGEIVLICDKPVADLPGLRYVCPPIWAARAFSRAGAKFLWTLAAGIRHGADLYMGYHIFPSAVTALICARLLGAKAAYQVTSGPLELEGGGWHAENRLLTALGRSSAWVETLAHAVTRQFDLVVVRGSTAAAYIQDKVKFRHSLEIITGSIESRDELMRTNRDIDVIFVGRLTEYKRPDHVIHAIAMVAQQLPSLRAVLVGDGPERTQLQMQVERLGIKENVEFLGQRSDVPELLGRARVFILPSRWEGVSIAMLEAMALGAVPVVSDVGDLRDFIENNVTGFILESNDIIGFGQHIFQLLSNETLRIQLAHNARERVVSRCDRKLLAQRWNKVFIKTIAGDP